MKQQDMSRISLFCFWAKMLHASRQPHGSHMQQSSQASKATGQTSDYAQPTPAHSNNVRSRLTGALREQHALACQLRAPYAKLTPLHGLQNAAPPSSRSNIFLEKRVAAKRNVSKQRQIKKNSVGSQSRAEFRSLPKVGQNGRIQELRKGVGAKRRAS